MAVCQLCESPRATVIDTEVVSVEAWVAEDPTPRRQVLALLACVARVIRRRVVRCPDCRGQYLEVALSSEAVKAYLRGDGRSAAG